MKEISINNQQLAIKEYNNQRVVTFSDIDAVHQRAKGTAKRNFKENHTHFIEGEDYYKVSHNDVGTNFVLTYGFDKKAPSGIILTESGYLMLVKSFTDELAWEVQRKLVNTYFRVKSIVKKTAEDKARMLATREENIKVRKAQLLFRVSEKCGVESCKQVLHSHITLMLTGQELLPLPKAEHTTYTAGQIGEMLGISANMVGKLANRHGLKTAEYGETVWDKSPYSAHQCQTFRYYISVVPALKKLLDTEVA